MTRILLFGIVVGLALAGVVIASVMKYDVLLMVCFIIAFLATKLGMEVR